MHQEVCTQKRNLEPKVPISGIDLQGVAFVYNKSGLTILPGYVNTGFAQMIGE